MSNSLTRIRPLDWWWTRPGFEIHKFVIVRGRDAIGVGIIERDLRNDVCSMVLGLLPGHRGKQFGSVAARLLVRKSFTEFNAIRVESSALSCNPASVQMQDGMIQEGTLKSRFLIDGERVDEMVFRLLRSEWERQIAERVAGTQRL
jgi:RimJ/RimL family protein N-acetyltransferase